MLYLSRICSWFWSLFYSTLPSPSKQRWSLASILPLRPSWWCPVNLFCLIWPLALISRPPEGFIDSSSVRIISFSIRLYSSISDRGSRQDGVRSLQQGRQERCSQRLQCSSFLQQRLRVGNSPGRNRRFASWRMWDCMLLCFAGITIGTFVHVESGRYLFLCYTVQFVHCCSGTESMC